MGSRRMEQGETGLGCIEKQTKIGTCSWTWIIQIAITNLNNIYKLEDTDEKRLNITWGVICIALSFCLAI